MVVLDARSWPIAFSEQTRTVFIGPAGSGRPVDDAEVFDPDGPWELLYPLAPDVLDGEDGNG